MELFELFLFTSLFGGVLIIEFCIFIGAAYLIDALRRA